MRILLYGLNYAPELTGIGKYSGEMVEWLAGRGHEVRVLTAPPYYPAWRVQDDFSSWRYQVEKHGSTRVYRCPLWVPGKPNGMKRMAHLASFAAHSCPVALSMVRWRPEAVVVIEPTMFCAPVGLLVASLAGAQTWLHIQDFEVDAAFDLGLLRSGGRLHRSAVALDRAITKRFDHVSSISKNMVQRILSKGIQPEKAVLLPNWVDTDSIYPMKGANRWRKAAGLPADKILLLYSGNMGMKQGLEILPALAQYFRDDPQIHFVFCGDGAFRPKLEELVAGLGNVTLLPLQPMELLNDLLNAADIHLLPQKADAADLVMPSKLTGMMASGRPTIATAAPHTQVAEVIRGCGIAVPAGDLEGFAAAIKTLAASPDLRHKMGTAARRYAVEYLGRDQVLLRFEARLMSPDFD